MPGLRDARFACNICYFSGSPLFVVLREGSSIYNVLKEVLQGGTLQHAVQHAHLSQALLTALSSPEGIEYLKVAYVLDIFSRYGVILMIIITTVITPPIMRLCRASQIA